MDAVKTLVFTSPKLTKRKLNEIRELVSKFKKLTNFFLRICIKHGVFSKAKLHSISYHSSKTVVPQNEIHSKYRYKALSLALGIYKSWRKRVKRKLTNKLPEFTSNVILMYNDSSGVSTFKLILRKEKHVTKLFVRIATKPRKYVTIPLHVGNYHERYLEQIRKGKIRIADAKLVLRNDEKVEFHLTIKKNPKLIQAESTLTVDINERNVTVVIFDNKTKKEMFAEIIDTSRIFEIDSTYFKIQRKLQEKLYKAHNPKYIPKWKKDTLKKRLRRWKQRRDDLLHKLSKYIIDLARTFRARIILEDLKYIKQKIPNRGRKMNRRLSLAPFRKLQQMIEYKAKWYGIHVVYVNPKGTSSFCPRCGQRMTMTGKPRVILCPKCRIMYHRDYLACINLAKLVMGGASVPHDSPMKLVRRGVVLPNEVRVEGKACAMIDSYTYV